MATIRYYRSKNAAVYFCLKPAAGDVSPFSKIVVKTVADDLAGRIALHNKADIGYYEFGRRILELAENAEKLMKIANPQEKRELTQFLLSNSVIKDGEPIFSLKKPYSAITKRAPCGTRLAWQGL